MHTLGPVRVVVVKTEIFKNRNRTNCICSYENSVILFHHVYRGIENRVSEIFMYAKRMMMVRGGVAVRAVRGGPRATTCERVLRYPDGHERRIRYPCPMAEEMIVGDVQGHVCDLEEEEEKTSVAEASIDVEYRGDVFINKEEEEDGLPTQSPLELLRFVMSDAYKEKQKNEYEEVKNSFDICHGCPWPVPKAVYTLAVQDGRAAAAARVYAPRTRIFQEGVQSEMTMLLEENRRKNGKVRKTKPVIECSSMVDGVVIFQDESQAMAFGKELEKHVGNTVVLAEHDSHELFRNINETKGVGVVMKKECILPACGS
eukprot:jgi/Picre1/31174/NNA_006528.t1